MEEKKGRAVLKAMKLTMVVTAKTLIKNGLITEEEFINEIKSIIKDEEDKQIESEILEKVKKILKY